VSLGSSADVQTYRRADMQTCIYADGQSADQSINEQD
jgi:hypothetical protein